MRVFDSSLTLYRKTVKRLRPVHVALHTVITHGIIPVLERVRGFRTIPDDPFWFRLELLTNRHEAATVKVLDQFLKPGITVLDIGAHVGYYARHCAQRIGSTGRIIAFEPHPRTYQTLRRNTAQFSNVAALQLAVAEEEGTAELYDYLMMSASGSLHYDEDLRALQKAQLSDSDIAPRIANDFPVETFTVQTRPIDACLSELAITQVDLVKMDIEGAEIGALRGMRNTIANSPNLALIMEYNPQALSAFDFVPEDALAEVMGLGFSRMQAIHEDGTITDLTGDAAALAALTAQLNDHMGVVNLLFTRA